MGYIRFAALVLAFIAGAAVSQVFIPPWRLNVRSRQLASENEVLRATVERLKAERAEMQKVLGAPVER